MASDTVIIGGGLSGTLVAIQLLRRLGEGDSVTVIERSGECGKGIAYGTQNVEHLLNVPAYGMTAFPDIPDDFVQWWCDRTGFPLSELRTSFAPRMVYSFYLCSRLKESIESSPVKFRVVAGSALSARRRDGRFQVQVDSGEVIDADKVVLALGNHPPATSGPLSKLAGLDAYEANPWKSSALGGLTPEDEVLLIGTGLTMVDAIVSLLGSGHTGRIVAFSRRGLIPQCHRIGTPPRYLDLSATPTTVKAMCTAVVDGVRANVAAGSDWRGVIDGLRAETPKIWARLPWDERRRFLSRLTPYWDIHRHRLAPQIYELLMSAIERGQLEVMSANLSSAVQEGDKARVILRRKDGREEVLTVSRIVNCTGPDTNLRRVKIPLIENLVESHLTDYDPLGMGLMVDDLGATSTPGLYALGPVCRGCRWETTAAPEIRVQAETIAREICHSQ